MIRTRTIDRCHKLVNLNCSLAKVSARSAGQLVTVTQFKLVRQSGKLHYWKVLLRLYFEYTSSVFKVQS